MSRVLALLVAVFLIVAAVVVRNAIDEDGGGGNDDGTTLVVCATELEAVCDEVGRASGSSVRFEDAAVTADRLSSGSDAPELDVWVTFDPWPDIVDDNRTRGQLQPLFAGDEAPVARSPLAVVGPDALTDCNWRCIGERAGDGLKLGSRRLTSGLGTIHLGAAASGWFETPDFARIDMDDPEFVTWFAGLRSGVKVDTQPVTTLLRGPFFDAALSYEAEARTALDNASADRTEGIEVLYPAPVAYLDVVVAGVDGAAPDDLSSDMAAELHARGWDAPSDESNGLPSAGVLVALRQEL